MLGYNKVFYKLGDIMFICAGESEQFVFAKSIGIGLTSSSISLTRICLQYAPKELIFIGSAGCYCKDWHIGDIAYSYCATQIELSFLENKTYTPIDNSIKLDFMSNVSHETLTNNWSCALEKIPQVIVNSSNYITKINSYNDMMIHAGITLENMEFFSVLKVAQYFQIPCIGIFCVSNFVGTQAHEEFMKNHELVKIKLHDFVTKQYFK